MSSDAEYLLDLAEAVVRPKSVVLQTRVVRDVETDAAVVALALRLRSRADVAFRALAEGWDRWRTVRELY